MTENGNTHLTSGRLLARNTLWNLVGNGAPLVIALFCIPALIRGLGTDRFGLLALAWTLVGYASLFDLGLGRALTQVVARKLGAGEESEVPSILWTSLLLLSVFSLLGTAVVAVLAPWLVHRVLTLPQELQPEAVSACILLALSIPLVVASASLRGFLEAYQRFDLTNALRIPTGALTFLGPLLVLPFSKSIVAVMCALVLARSAALVAHLFLCFRVAPSLRRGMMWNGGVVRQLLSMGGWMTVSNVVGPLMTSLDRFVIGAMLTVTAVSFYVTPYEFVTKLWLIPTAVAAVLFPAFSTTCGQDSMLPRLLSRRAVKAVLLVLFPIVVCIVVFAKDGLTLWLGRDFAEHSFRVLQWLTLGVLSNCLGQIPFALLQGAGRPDLTAKLHLGELPFYLIVLWWLIKTHGIEGAAIAWSLRAGVDTVLLFVLADWLASGPPLLNWRTGAFASLCVGALLVGTLPGALVWKAGVVLVLVAGFAVVMWMFVFTPEDRNVFGNG